MIITLSTTSFHVIASILHYDIKLVLFLPTSNHSMLLTVLTEVKVRSETEVIFVSLDSQVVHRLGTGAHIA